LAGAGYRVVAINPMQVARYRERYSTSGAKSDAGDARVLADIERWKPTGAAREPAIAIQVLARAHQSGVGAAEARSAAADSVAGLVPSRVGRLRR
jgi:hypothetical protein